MNVNMDNENAEKQCAVCRRSLDDSSIISVTDCGHRLHSECVQSISETEEFKCPLRPKRKKSIVSKPKYETEKEDNVSNINAK
jgi:hypothetical protein